jgi:hypothetical protein
MSTETLTYRGSLVVSTCWCGMRHAVPEELRDYQKRQHANGEPQMSIYCPLGHSHVKSGKGEAEKLRQHLEWERERSARLAAERDQAQASARSYKGVATKARKRAAAAVCPCCKRSFVQLRRHMEAQHPDYDPAVA